MHLRAFAYRPTLHQPPHAHDYASISLVARGEVRETAGREEWAAGAGYLIVKPRDVMHEDRFGVAGARMFTLVCDDEDVGAYRWLFGGAAVALFLRAIEEWRAGAVYDDIAIDVIAATWDGELRASKTTAMREVAEHIESGVSVAAIARQIGMHPVALARAFRREHGCSMTAYRRRAQLRQTADFLSATHMPLAAVAQESGFSDQSHLSRIFKRELGVTPLSFRRATA